MDEKKENKLFQHRLNHFILYSKGWYDFTINNNKLELYKAILKLDGFEFVRTIHDVVDILLHEFDRYNAFLRKTNPYASYDFFKINKLINEKITLCKLNYEEALIEVIKAIFNNLSKSEIKLSKPIYSRKMFKQGIIFGGFISKNNIGMTYKEQNMLATKTFG